MRTILYILLALAILAYVWAYVTSDHALAAMAIGIMLTTIYFLLKTKRHGET